ncbi:hypothetical protein C1H46_004158 [Malus baccata]|uniref:Uncharacterized protein n=1 Tax=Malus baccata TaxID=106549 RepID=A0A540NGP7_MALBA|nr:hypothetical protein C1H46_004158 [Malus baccata]
MKCKSICTLQNLETMWLLEAKKKLWSVLPRRRRPQISPIYSTCFVALSISGSLSLPLPFSSDIFSLTQAH